MRLQSQLKEVDAQSYYVFDNESKKLGYTIRKDQVTILCGLYELQCQLNNILGINRQLTDRFIKHRDEKKAKNSSSDGSTLVSRKFQFEGERKEKIPSENIIIVEPKKKLKKPQNRFETLSESDYAPSEEQQNNALYKLSESKNIPKNYGKSILNFIKKNQIYTNFVVKKYGVDTQKFKLYLVKLKNRINTIAQLRSLWIESSLNQFAQVLRIISCEYLRKHCLNHIFNSRIQNYGKNIKYRHKMLKAVQNPTRFTQMKDF